MNGNGVQDDLFLLVQSLSLTERAYFIKHAASGMEKTPNYMVLYNALSKMEEYDEEKLKALKLKNLSYEKNYLMNTLLKLMRSYRNDTSADVQIKGFILDAKFLLERGFYKKSQQFLKKAKKLAEKHHNTLALLEINQVERRILIKTQPSKLDKQIASLVRSQQKLLNVIFEEGEYSNYHYTIYSKFVQKMWLYNINEQQEFLANYPQLNAEIKDLKSERSKLSYLNAQKFTAQLLGDREVVLDFCNQIIDWWENQKEIKEDSPFAYTLELFNLITACFFLKKYDIVSKTFKKIEDFKSQNSFETTIVFQMLIQSKQVYFMNLGKFEKAKKYIKEIETEVLTRKLDNRTKTIIICNFSIIFFFLEDFWDCIKWINEGLKNKNVSERIGIQKFMRILKCICYWELEQTESFELAMRATTGFLKGIKEPKNSFEYQVISFLKKIESSPLGELNKIYQDFHNFLIEKKQSPKKLKAHGLDEYFYWINSKINKKSMIDLVQSDLHKVANHK